jgi:HTH-type transcriptional regulator/antitoxin HipB
MEKVIKKIEDKIDDDDDDENEDDDDDDDEDEDVGVFLKKEDGHYKVQVKKTKVKTRFWLEVPYPIICAISYLIFGFYDICGGWALSWVISVTIPIYYTLVEAIYKRSFAHFAYPVLCAFVYLVCGMYFNNWHPSWLIFITVAIYYPIAEALDKYIRRR